MITEIIIIYIRLDKILGQLTFNLLNLNIGSDIFLNFLYFYVFVLFLFFL